MKGGLTIDNPVGPRWDLALDLLEEGREFVLWDNLQLARHHGWPGADGRVHAAVLTPGGRVPSEENAQREVNEARERFGLVLGEDDRLRSIIEAHGIVWEYAGDDGTATWLIATVADDGQLLWARP